MKIKGLLLVALVLTWFHHAPARQKTESKGEAAASGAAAVSDTASPSEIAHIALARQGGDKFRNLKSLSLFGSAVLYYGSRPSDSTSGQFAIVHAGARARLDLETPDGSYREIHDGDRGFRTVNPASAPPPRKFGL